MTPLLLAAVACALAAPVESAAPPPPAPVEPFPLVLGLRAGVALPTGSVASGAKLGDAIQRAYPIELRAGWRITPEIVVGLQGGYAPATVAPDREDQCRLQGVSCDAHLWRLSARGEYSRKVPGWVSIPWGAVTAGWEWAVDRWEFDSGTWEKRSTSGLLVGIEAGIDRPVAKHLTVGIFAGASFGQYTLRSVSGETVGYAYSDSASVTDPALHGWLSVGVRAGFPL